jgi:hypothetical protein
LNKADIVAVLRLLRKDLEQVFTTAATAVGEARAMQQQKQQHAYRQVLERIYTSAAAAADNTSSSSSGSGSGSSSKSIAELLLPQLTVSPPEGQADSFDYISQAWEDYSDGKILDIDSILGHGAKPTGVQRWLLPQLLDDAQPPLLVVAPPGSGRVTAVLLAAAAELAAAAAGEQEGEEREEDTDTAYAAAAAATAAGDGSKREREAEGREEEGEGVDVVLPWEVEDAAAASELGVEGKQQDRASSAPARTAAAAAAGEGEGEGGGRGGGEGEGGGIDGPDLCSPFLLLTLPTQAAAAAAAAQHSPVMAAAGVRLGLLPSLDQQLQQQWEAAVEARDVAVRKFEAAKRLWQSVKERKEHYQEVMGPEVSKEPQCIAMTCYIAFITFFAFLCSFHAQRTAARQAQRSAPRTICNLSDKQHRQQK